MLGELDAYAQLDVIEKRIDLRAGGFAPFGEDGDEPVERRRIDPAGEEIGADLFERIEERASASDRSPAPFGRVPHCLQRQKRVYTS